MNELSQLGSYLEVFCHEAGAPLQGFGATPPPLVIPAPVVSNSFPLKLIQAFLNAKGYRGKNKKPLVEDDAWGANTAFALDSFDAALAKQRGKGARLSKVWSYLKATNNVDLEPSVGNMVRNWAGLDAKAKRIMSEPKVAPRVPPDMRATGPATAISAPTKTTPAPAKKTAPVAGFASETALSLQQIVRALGVDIKADTLYGPSTRDAWLYVASLYKVDGRSVADGKYRAWVDPTAFALLRVKARSGPGPKVSIAEVRKRLNQPKTAAKPAAKPAPAPAAPKPATARDAMQASAADVQVILRGLGVKGKGLSDGVWGPSTKNAWETVAKRRGLDPWTSGKTGARAAQVIKATYAGLLAASKERATAAPAPQKAAAPKPAKAAPAKPTEPSKPGMAKQSVGSLQDILIKLGNKKLKRDGDFGPATAGAWKAAATRRKLDGTINRASPMEAWVMPATFQKLGLESGLIKAPGAPAPAPIPAAPAPAAPKPSAKTKIKVAKAQEVLNTLGAKLKADGDFGPKTAAAWAAAAKARKLNGAFVRASAKEATVSLATYQQLALEAGAKKLGAKPAAAPAPAAAKPASGKPADAVKVNPVDIANIFKLYGLAPKNTQAFALAWASLASKESSASIKLSPYFVLVGSNVEVSKTTFDTLKDKSAREAQVAALIKMANVTLPVKTLQEAILAAKAGPVKATGVWDGPTETAFFVLFKIPANAVSLWERALPKLIGAQRKSVRVLPEQAKVAGELAKRWQAQAKLDQKASKLQNFQRVDRLFLIDLLNDADLTDAIISDKSTFAQLKPIYEKMAKKLDKNANVEIIPGANDKEVLISKSTIKTFETAASGAVQALIKPVVTKSTDRVTLLLVKQALMQTRELQLKGTVAGPVFASLDLTKNTWEPPMTGMLMRAVGTYLFPGRTSIDPKIWEMLINRLREVGGTGFMVLPPAVAKILQDRAAEYVAARGPSKEITPAMPISVPVPSKGGVVRGEVIPITGRVPPPAPAPPEMEPEPQPFVESQPVPQGENIQVPVIETPEGRRLDTQTGMTSEADMPAAPQPLVTGAPEPPPAPIPMMTSQPSITGPSITGPSVQGPSITGPSINIQLPTPSEPAPVQPVAASAAGGNMGLIIGLAAAGLIGALLLRGSSSDQGAPVY